MQQLNAAFYCFAELGDPGALKRDLRPSLERLGVRGTVIIAPEGINGFLAGGREAVQKALELLRSFTPFAGLRSKESSSTGVPFEKLCIKVKKEIVTFRRPGHSPLETDAVAGRLSPAELDSWFRDRKEFVLLDTRNSYESRLGTFRGAHTPAMDHFVEFPSLVESLPEDWKKKPVVTFCTGGIRCEKAAPFLAAQGFENVWQLEGGILGYFEAMGGKHWEGECFVFDQRVALGPDLAPTGARLCPHCQGPVPSSHSSCIHCKAAL
ncbi:MAG TPA: rhodanese-like domain-containing protein [Bdellovibrionota bacterium]|jgi:predicted sulfurtransferase